MQAFAYSILQYSRFLFSPSTRFLHKPNPINYSLLFRPLYNRHNNSKQHKQETIEMFTVPHWLGLLWRRGESKRLTDSIMGSVSGLREVWARLTSTIGTCQIWTTRFIEIYWKRRAKLVKT